MSVYCHLKIVESASKKQPSEKEKENHCKLSTHVLLWVLLSIIDKLEALDLAHNETNIGGKRASKRNKQKKHTHRERDTLQGLVISSKIL